MSRLTHQLIGVVLTCGLLPGLTSGASLKETSPDFQKLVSSYGPQFAGLTSEEEAGQLFRSLAPMLGLAPVEKTQDSRGSTDPKLAPRLIAELATWRLAEAIRRATDLHESTRLIPIQQEIDRQAWLLDQPEADDLRRAARLVRVLTIRRPSLDGSGAAFEDYARLVDRTYPDLIEGEQSWTRLSEQEGSEGIQQRLAGLRNGLSADQTPEVLEARYFETRLRPVLTAQLAGRAMRAAAEAEHQVRRIWLRLHDQLDQIRHRTALGRLCGTWQWTIHNHQNHQEHKMRLSFPAPEQLESEAPGSSRPARIVVLGDAVYLRWEFQGGVQEDSLLFDGQGQRLEGSFTNSAGAWGSITGKRTASCEAQGKRQK
jgi:hypothetical protein